MQNTENKLQKQETAVQIPTGADYLRTRLWYKPDKTMHYDDFVVTPTGYVAKLLGTSSKTKLSINQYDMQFNCDSIVMLCTGLRDVNNVPIYEGDIVTNGTSTGIIRRDTELGSFYIETKLFRSFTDLRESMIIGNIYQTKELAQRIIKENKDNESN